MKYYLVLKDGYDYINKYGVVERELLTPHERNTKVRYLPDSYFKEVDISRKRTFFSFGVRLQMSE